MHLLVWMLLVVGSSVSLAGTAPQGSFDNAACIDCHQQRNLSLVRAWQSSAHARVEVSADCVVCHGASHENAAMRARQDAVCIDCHGGQKDPVVHSYSTSKHGLILRLEKKEWDWTQPLSQANYRTPGCAYCHMQGGGHNVAVRDVGLLRENKAEIELVQDTMRRVCQDCHAPRYITRLFENGEKMLALARMKVREAQALLLQAREQYSAEKLEAAEMQYKKMKSVHLRNVYLGVAHQSPDYQWWHGHPALDGDLLRIKGFISGLERVKKLP
ncbi:MAG: hypothetical protein GXP22_03625 [Gammaproteobacteria bacterium]|nr:hypothetical protein [Gammaproteobacteria bacterium]